MHPQLASVLDKVKNKIASHMPLLRTLLLLRATGLIATILCHWGVIIQPYPSEWQSPDFLVVLGCSQDLLSTPVCP